MHVVLTSGQGLVRTPVHQPIGLGDTSSSWLHSTITLPIIGAVNPYLLVGGIGLVVILLMSSEGKSYSREKTKRVRSAIHGARMTRATKRIDSAKKRLRAAESR